MSSLFWLRRHRKCAKMRCLSKHLRRSDAAGFLVLETLFIIRSDVRGFSFYQLGHTRDDFACFARLPFATRKRFQNSLSKSGELHERDVRLKFMNLFQ